MADDEFVLRGLRSPWKLRQPGELRGRVLRYLLTAFLAEAGGAITIKALIARCEREGVVFDGRASKIVSDALRWEISGARHAGAPRRLSLHAHAPID